MRRMFRWLFVVALVVCAGSTAALFNYYRMNEQGSEEYNSLKGTWTGYQLSGGSDHGQQPLSEIHL